MQLPVRLQSTNKAQAKGIALTCRSAGWLLLLPCKKIKTKPPPRTQRHPVSRGTHAAPHATPAWFRINKRG
eukprot:6262797-Prymnesium_polylepis.1